MVRTNDVLIGITLLERTLPLLKVSSREPISASTLGIIRRNIEAAVSKIYKYVSSQTILLPLMEITELIKVVQADESFVETDAETKSLISDKMNVGINSLYTFAGKFYIDNEFDYDMCIAPILNRIIDSCINDGFYFGYDTKIQEGSV